MAVLEGRLHTMVTSLHLAILGLRRNLVESVTAQWSGNGPKEQSFAIRVWPHKVLLDVNFKKDKLTIS